MKDELFVAAQRITPQHWLSRCAGWFADSEIPMIKNTFIRLFHDQYKPDMSQALVEDPLAYSSFNAFFSRAIKPESRPISPDPKAIVSPADGFVSQIGKIEDGRIFQAKGHTYSVRELLACDDSTAHIYKDGRFLTVYLTPRDYHRIHIPFAGTLRQMTHVPGRLFSVNTVTTEAVPQLFARNERVVCHFDTEIGPMVVVMVGAMIVASIETVWAGLVVPNKRVIRHTHYQKAEPYSFSKGDEIGKFLLGSTVIVLFPDETMEWLNTGKAGSMARMGETVGLVSPSILAE